jgi:hypothetical protein
MAHEDISQIAAVLGALGAAGVLLAPARALLLAAFGALGLAEAGLALALVPSSDLRHFQTLTGVAALAVAIAGVGALVALFVLKPDLVPLAVLLVMPFRLPVDLGRQHAFLLLPLYGVLAAASLALLFRTATNGAVARLPRLVSIPAAAFIGLDAISLLWSQDIQQGSIELAFFMFPFAALTAVVARAPFPERQPRLLATGFIGLTTVFALIGLWQQWTHRLFYAPSLEVENAYTSFFRVSSVFKDPSLFGRYLALGIVLLLTLNLLGKVRLAVAVPLIGILSAALWFTYSQSSMVALFAATLAVALVTLERRERVVVAGAAALAALVGAIVVGAHVQHSSARKFTSGRSRLIAVTGTVIRNHPLVGVGVGAQPVASRLEAARHTAATRNASHTTPLTVAAELGAVGFVAYLAFLGGAFGLLHRVARRQRVLATSLAAFFFTLIVHSLFYSGFFEDPIVWGIVAVAAAATLTAREVEAR